MIANKMITSVVFYIAWIPLISGASYSQVYVNSGPNGYRVVGYGAPPVGYNAALAQYNSAPVGSAVPLPQDASYLQPCVTPCIPTQSAVVPVSNANLVAYKAPLVVADDTPSTYQYSYVVYDDSTGDQKKQQELSDGGNVRGQYSFLQPDGYVRQVQYTADDTNGFNAVVNYLPGTVVQPAVNQQANPCDPPKSEAIKQAEKTVDNPDQTSSEDSGSNKVLVSDATDALTTDPPATDAPTTSAPPTTAAATYSTTTAAAVVDTTAKIPASDALTDGVAAVVKETTPDTSVDAVVQPIAPPQPYAPAIVTPNVLPVGYITYDQYNCLQKLQDLKNNSPLTYILLPSKPCN